MEKSLISVLANWFSNPFIEVRITDSERVKQLEEKNKILQAENHRLALQYMAEVEISLRATDKLKECGIQL